MVIYQPVKQFWQWEEKIKGNEDVTEASTVPSMEECEEVPEEPQSWWRGNLQEKISFWEYVRTSNRNPGPVSESFPMLDGDMDTVDNSASTILERLKRISSESRLSDHRKQNDRRASAASLLSGDLQNNRRVSSESLLSGDLQNDRRASSESLLSDDTQRTQTLSSSTNSKDAGWFSTLFTSRQPLIPKTSISSAASDEIMSMYSNPLETVYSSTLQSSVDENVSYQTRRTNIIERNTDGSILPTSHAKQYGYYDRQSRYFQEDSSAASKNSLPDSRVQKGGINFPWKIGGSSMDKVTTDSTENIHESITERPRAASDESIWNWISRSHIPPAPTPPHVPATSSTATGTATHYQTCHEPDDAYTVKLHVYDLHSSIKGINNMLMNVSNWGVYHVGIEVHGREYMYAGGATSRRLCTSDLDSCNDFEPEESGVLAHNPKQHEIHVFRETVILGRTTYSKAEIEQVLIPERLARKWPRRQYHFTLKNCLHFAEAFAKELEVGPLPDYIRNLMDIALSITTTFFSSPEPSEETARNDIRSINILNSFQNRRADVAQTA